MRRLRVAAACLALAGCRDEPRPAVVKELVLDVDPARGARGLEVDGKDIHLWLEWTLYDKGFEAPLSLYFSITSRGDGPDDQETCTKRGLMVEPSQMVHVSERPRRRRAELRFSVDHTCARAKQGRWLALALSLAEHPTQTVLIPTSLGGDGRPHSTMESEGERMLAGGYTELPPAAPTDDGADLAAYANLVPALGQLSEKGCPKDLPPVTLHLRYGDLVKLTACADAGALPPQPPVTTFLLGWAGSKPLRQRLESCGSLAPYAPSALPRAQDASLLIIRPTKGTMPSATGSRYKDPKTKETTFHAGTAEGELFVIDRRTKTLACAATYKATSSDSFAGKSGDLINTDLHNDLARQVSAAIMGTLTRLGAPHPDDLAGRD